VARGVASDAPHPNPPPLSADLWSACRVSTKQSFVRELGGGGSNSQSGGSPLPREAGEG